MKMEFIMIAIYALIAKVMILLLPRKMEVQNDK